MTGKPATDPTGEKLPAAGTAAYPDRVSSGSGGSPRGPRAPANRALTAIAAAVLLGGTVLLLFYRLGATAIERTSEKRCHEVAVHMLASGDWLVPIYNGEVRLQKPPLYYWLAASVARIAGEPSALSTRIPSALAALLAAVLVLVWCKRLLGVPAAILALGLLVTMGQFVSSGRRGDAETMLMAASLAALFCFERFAHSAWVAEVRTTPWLLLFGACSALAVLAKATAAFITVALPIAVFLWRQPELRTVLWKRTAATFAVAAAVGFTWYVVIALRVEGATELLLGDLILPVGVRGDAADDAAHYKAPWYFASKLVSVAAPATVLLPALVWRLWTTRCYRADRAMSLVALAFVTEFVAFSILPQKQRHYLLPLLPLLAIVLAESSFACAAAFPRFCRRLALAAGTLATLAGAAVVAFLSVYFATFESDRSFLRFVVLPLATLGFVATSIAVAARSYGPAFVLLVASSLVVRGIHSGHVDVWHSRIDEALEDDMPVPEAEKLLAVDAEKPWLIRLLDAEDFVEDIREQRDVPSEPPEPESAKPQDR